MKLFAIVASKDVEMRTRITIVVLGAALAPTACEKTDHGIDRFIDHGQLAEKVKWGLYVDPDGRTGERVCSGVLPKGYAANHKRGSQVPDPI